jgi:myosin heavy subunit
VLELGNISFRKDSRNGKTKVNTADPQVEAALGRFMQLLEVSDRRTLEQAFSTRTVRAGRRTSVSVIELSVEQANEARDGLAKTLYASLFEWVVRRVNIATRIAIPSKDAPDPALQSKTKPFIGILDIFGYEVLQDNSFEQLCIAFANQSLQHIFDRHWEAQEKREYDREGVSHAKVAFRDNEALLRLLDSHPHGIFQLLDEQILLGSKATDEAFLLKVNMVHGTATAGTFTHTFKHTHTHIHTYLYIHTNIYIQTHTCRSVCVVASG